MLDHCFQQCRQTLSSVCKKFPGARTAILRELSFCGELTIFSLIRVDSKTIYRYVDLNKAYLVLLRHLYKTLHNISTRRRVEEEEPSVRAVLEKKQRSDVSQDLERLLTRNERETLSAWEYCREKLTVAEMRVEEAVFILRTLVVSSNED